MTTTTGEGRGKLILCGEHAVVYGHPAIAVALDLGTTVILTRQKQGWTLFTNVQMADEDEHRLRQALAARLGTDGYQLRVESTVPMGRGMGSSAALSVAAIRAWAANQRTPLTDDALFDHAMALERVFHGNPSGIDVAVAQLDHGGALFFQRGPPMLRDPIAAPRGTLVALDSGVAGNTRELVTGVATRRPAIDPHLEAIGELVRLARKALDTPAHLGPLLTRNHELLEMIGVSTPALNALVQLALDNGALGAKLSGAGGGGVVLALTEDPDPILDAARAQGTPAWVCLRG